MQKEENNPSGMEKELMSIETFCEVYAVNESRFYFYKNSGKLKTIKDGKRTLISREAAQEWKRNLIASQENKE